MEQMGYRLCMEQKTVATCFAALDEIIWAVPCGQVSEIVGRPTSGMSTLAHYLMASAQQTNRHVVFVDMGTTFSGQYAPTCGVNVDDIVLVDINVSRSDCLLVDRRAATHGLALLNRQ
jgi:RecA/RadA recombinase